ncbi:hypothetical protein VCHA57P526_120026 [Vibrio chagasii]|nr:hypothetical protein VCHA28FP16_130026 [Vibrio chagasii]CAH6825147.1 hypothetical protein VCHA34P115_160111 [Vibrio chagasii]CAH6831551.1 hypothetical protein VCHA31O73_10026 [Vibrio chagasii]CAH6878261.1 hypothetical protein VCHA31O71_20026 [Vibrio chagasii]CAH6896046.1 hypothetical protein VCHA36O163_20601 [Vibrio chagasii]
MSFSGMTVKGYGVDYCVYFLLAQYLVIVMSMCSDVPRECNRLWMLNCLLGIYKRVRHT